MFGGSHEIKILPSHFHSRETGGADASLLSACSLHLRVNARRPPVIGYRRLCTPDDKFKSARQTRNVSVFALIRCTPLSDTRRAITCALSAREAVGEPSICPPPINTALPAAAAIATRFTPCLFWAARSTSAPGVYAVWLPRDQLHKLWSFRTASAALLPPAASSSAIHHPYSPNTALALSHGSFGRLEPAPSHPAHTVVAIGKGNARRKSPSTEKCSYYCQIALYIIL